MRCVSGGLFSEVYFPRRYVTIDVPPRVLSLLQVLCLDGNLPLGV